MRKLHYKITVLVAMLISTHIKAQIPFNDPAAWKIQPALCDSFNGSTLSSKWVCPYDSSSQNNATMCRLANATVSSGILNLRIDNQVPHLASRTHDEPDSLYYNMAFIQTHAQSYHYGYIEAKAKFPVGDSLYSPAFWIYGSNCGALTHVKWYNEIDIVENFYDISFNGHEVTSNVHIWRATIDSCPNSIPDSSNYEVDGGLPRLSSDYHIYGLQWDATHLYFYFDNNLIRAVSDPTGNTIPQDSMVVTFDFNTGFVYDSLHHYPPITPAYFLVDYMNYYKLIPACTTPKTLCTPSAYDHKVYQSINTGGSCSLTFSDSTIGTSYTLRAVNYVELDAGTTISPSGTGYFAIETTVCPQ